VNEPNDVAQPLVEAASLELVGVEQRARPSLRALVLDGAE
jgi:hypothetical protein